MQLIYPLPIACFLNIPYSLIGSEGMLTPRSVPGVTVPGPMFGSVYLMSRPRCHFTTPFLSTRLGSVHLGTGGSPQTRFGGGNGWSPDTNYLSIVNPLLYYSSI